MEGSQSHSVIYVCSLLVCFCNTLCPTWNQNQVNNEKMYSPKFTFHQIFYHFENTSEVIKFPWFGEVHYLIQVNITIYQQKIMFILILCFFTLDIVSRFAIVLRILDTSWSVYPARGLGGGRCASTLAGTAAAVFWPGSGTKTKCFRCCNKNLQVQVKPKILILL